MSRPDVMIIDTDRNRIRSLRRILREARSNLTVEEVTQPNQVRAAVAQERHEDADEIYRWALDASENAVGPQSANTTFLRNQYVQYLRARGQDAEADRLSVE